MYCIVKVLYELWKYNLHVILLLVIKISYHYSEIPKLTLDAKLT